MSSALTTTSPFLNATGSKSNLATAPSLPTSNGIFARQANNAPPLPMGQGGRFGRPTVGGGILANVLTEVQASVAPTGSALPNVGAPGSANNAGNIAGAGSNNPYLSGNGSVTGALTQLQLKYQPIDTLLRIGLPVAGVLLLHGGHTVGGVALIGAGAVLWANRLGAVSL